MLPRPVVGLFGGMSFLEISIQKQKRKLSTPAVKESSDSEMANPSLTSVTFHATINKQSVMVMIYSDIITAEVPLLLSK